MSTALTTNCSVINEKGRQIVEVPQSVKGCVLWGPYELVDPGSYVIAFEIVATDFDEPPQVCGHVDVFASTRSEIVVERPVTIPELNRTNNVIELSFTLYSRAVLEYRVHSYGGARLLVAYRRRPQRIHLDHPAAASNGADSRLTTEFGIRRDIVILDEPRRARRELEQGAKSSALWAHFGRALSEQGLVHEAEPALRSALGLDDRTPGAHLALGDALKAQGRQAEAEVAYVTAYRLYPGSQEAGRRLRTIPAEAASPAFQARLRSLSEASSEDLAVARERFLRALGLPARSDVPSPSDRVGAPPLRLLPEAKWGLALIATRNYVPHARVAARSFLAHHPDFEVYLLLVDGEEADGVAFPEGRLVWLSDLDVPHASWRSAKYTATEFANALKPAFLLYLANFVERAVYMDVDIMTFSRLTELVASAEAHDLVLIPHMLGPFPHPEHYQTHPSRSDVFNSGIVNAGCFAARLGAITDFLNFWDEANFAPGSFYQPAGYQTDQHYLNWAIARVGDVVVLRESRYNVAYWNLHERNLRRARSADETAFDVDGKPLGFFHFSGYDVRDPYRISRHDHRNSVYNLPAVVEILRLYSAAVVQAPDAELLRESYRFDELANGFRMTHFIREILKKYETHIPKFDVWTEAGADALCAFLMDPAPASGSMLPLVLAEIYERRPDLQRNWPGCRTSSSPEALWRWFCRHGGEEFPIQLLIDRFRRTLISDSLCGFAEQTLTLASRTALRFLGPDRLACGSFLREAGEAQLGAALLEARDEWFYFTDLGAALTLYRRRSDLQARFPDIFDRDHAAFCDWLENQAVETHGCPPAAAQRLRRCRADETLARVFCFLMRRDDVAAQCAPALLSDDVEPLLTRLLRAVGGGVEFDLDDVLVLQQIHQSQRHLLVPLFLELPLIRKTDGASRVTGRNINALPHEIRGQEWAQRGAQIHARLFDSFEAFLDEEVRKAQPHADLRPSNVIDYLKTIERDVRQKGALNAACSAAFTKLPADATRDERVRGRIEERRRTPGVNVFGYFAADIGVGESSRGLMTAIAMLRPANAVPIGTGHVRQGTSLRDMFQRFDHLSDTNVFVTFPHQIEDLLGMFRREWTENRRNIAYLAWEQRDANPLWKTVYDRYDELWAISDFAATGFYEMFPGRVRVVPNVVDFEHFPPVDKPDRLRGEEVNFLFVFDANSSIERKNPEGVITAFSKAFRDTVHAERVRLTLKISSMDRPEHASRIEKLMRMASDSGLRVRFDGRRLDRNALLRLIAEADCYVSLHHAEGFGYTMAEAMGYGAPVIASGYSGNLEYMTSENSFLVPCKESFVKAPDGPFQCGSVWGDPDLDVAAEMMRGALERPGDYLQTARRGREDVMRQLSAASVMRLIEPCFANPVQVEDAAGYCAPSPLEAPLQ